MTDSKLQWYWHRLRAMDSAEIAGRLRKKWFQWRDRNGGPAWKEFAQNSVQPFPRLPDPARIPRVLRDALQQDVVSILAGRWRAFGQLELQVDVPPRWHKDYLAGVELATNRSAFSLNHRRLPQGADVKLIWEWSRWNPLVRLAMASWALGDARAERACVSWLRDWVANNPPYQGWNWTSALESGMRLIQFVWIDALLTDPGMGERSGNSELSTSEKRERRIIENSGREGDQRLLTSSPTGGEEWAVLRREILPAHVWYTWRHRSFGSSANNHLIGELTGLLMALARWPELASLGVSLDGLQKEWEREVLAQFAEDGGNREQALNYQLFTWELCWQARAALTACSRGPSQEVETRLRRAADFFATVQVEKDPWDYGDSDNAFVTPFFSDERMAVAEWHAWFNEPERSPSLCFWWGDPPPPLVEGSRVQRHQDWLIYPDSGLAVNWTDDWNVRWDASPLGYLSTAAHGHMDALHLSFWYQGTAFVIDPGTGAYYGDPGLREHLASWDAHNGPHPQGVMGPRRLGPFLWSEHHAMPHLKADPDGGLMGSLELPTGRVERIVKRVLEGNGWQVDDQFIPKDPRRDEGFTVCWQFAPGTRLEAINERRFFVHRQGIRLVVGFDSAWRKAELIDPAPRPVPHPYAGEWAGVCSPSFRRVAFGPMVRLTAAGYNPCLFRTTFLASADS